MSAPLLTCTEPSSERSWPGFPHRGGLFAEQQKQKKKQEEKKKKKKQRERERERAALIAFTNQTPHPPAKRFLCSPISLRWMASWMAFVQRGDPNTAAT